MPYLIRFSPEKVIGIDDLPGSAVNKIAKKHGLSWFDLYAYPGRDLDALRDLVALAAGEIDADMPPAETVGELRDIVNLIDYESDDDRPQTHDEGGLPLVDEIQTG